MAQAEMRYQEKENELNEHRQALTTFSRFHANGTAFNETYAQNKWAKLSCIKPGSKKPLGYRYIKYTKRREQTFSIKLVLSESDARGKPWKKSAAWKEKRRKKLERKHGKVGLNRYVKNVNPRAWLRN